MSETHAASRLALAAALALFALTAAAAPPKPVPAGMVALPAGSFEAGDPPRKVSVRPFLIDVTEVTAGEYAACVAAKKCSDKFVDCQGGLLGAPTWGVPGKERHPMTCVEWSQAAGYCTWAGKRLPQAVEWEWAARGAGAGATFPWGNEPPAARACWNGEGNALGAGLRKGSCEVGSHPAGDSPQGVKDLAGNVAEWTGTAEKGGMKVVRGGSWADGDSPLGAAAVATATQGAASANHRAPSLGFRCARYP